MRPGLPGRAAMTVFGRTVGIVFLAILNSAMLVIAARRLIGDWRRFKTTIQAPRIVVYGNVTESAEIEILGIPLLISQSAGGIQVFDRSGAHLLIILRGEDARRFWGMIQEGRLAEGSQ